MDGYNRFADGDHNDDGKIDDTEDNTPPTAAQGAGFVPVVVEVPAWLDLSVATFRVIYDGSDPLALSRSGQGTISSPYVYSPAEGKLRLWKKNEVENRDGRRIEDGGDYVAPSIGEESYTSSNWSRIGITEQNRTVTLWVEAMAPSLSLGDLGFGFYVDPDGDANDGWFILGDTVNFTAIDVDVMIGANDPGDASVHDDWVGAKEGSQRHAILNWLITLTGYVDTPVRMATDGSVGAGSGLAVAPAGNNGALEVSNLRITDSDTSLVGTDDNQYIYYLGHPTEGLAQVGAIDANYATRVVVSTKEWATYQARLRVVQLDTGTPLPLPYSPAELNQMKVEISRIWEQVGIRIAFVDDIVTVNLPVQWDLPNDNLATRNAIIAAGGGRIANVMDVYLVNSIWTPDAGYLGGVTSYEGEAGEDMQGVFIASRLGTGLSTTQNVSQVARTAAHEIGHYFRDNSDHSSDIWNLMRSGDLGQYVNADLTLHWKE